MALFDVNNLFWHTGTAYQFTAGEYLSLVGCTSTSAALTGSVIALTNARDMGLGDGEFVPHILATVGSASITAGCSSLRINVQFQGSTDSVTWTTYAESGALSTASYLANSAIPLSGNPIPRRLPGGALPAYYRLNLAMTTGLNESISAGSVIGGLVIQAPSGVEAGSYAAGFTVS